MRGNVGWLAAAAIGLAIAGFGDARAEVTGGAPGTVEIVIEPTQDDGAGGAVEGNAEKDKPGKTEKKGAKSSSKKSAADEPLPEKTERMKATFAEFCTGWIEKLRERERYNLAKIKWETAADGGVFGEYVGYDTANPGPQTVGNVDTTPIGKLVYMEFRLRRSGKSKEEALAGEPEILERTEVTEIFRHDRTGWVY